MRIINHRISIIYLQKYINFMTLNIKSIGSGKPLVLLHGWGFDHTVWCNLVETIKNTYTIYLVDLPGFGNSPMIDWEAFKKSLLERLPAYFALLGWSMGGLYATRLALEVENRVTQLINVASSPRFLIDREWPGIEEKILAGFYKNVLKDSREALSQFIALQLQTSHYENRSNFLPSNAGLEAGLKTLATWDLRNNLDNLKCPACYMFGRLDGIVPSALRKAMQTRWPHFDYVLFNKSAHVPFISDKDVFIGELERFLA